MISLAPLLHTGATQGLDQDGKARSATGSQYKQLRSRITRDVRDLVRGTTLYIPIGEAVDEVRVGAQAVEITRSLRTTNNAEAIAHNAAALSYLDNVYSFHRCAKPVALSRKQCTALAGEWYRSWASDATASEVDDSDPEAAVVLFSTHPARFGLRLAKAACVVREIPAVRT